MPVEIKVCGLTRPADARLATTLGAHYLGFIFAPSPRQLTLAAASTLLAELAATAEDGPDVGTQDVAGAGAGTRVPRRVGVFAGMALPTVATIASRLALDVIQLHDGVTAEAVRTLRAASDATIWTVVHVDGDGIAPGALEAAVLGDAILLDAKVDGRLGGTGRTFDWEAARELVAPLRSSRRVILAGGLRADNVARAIRLFSPDAVDVSSGIEAAPGVKDPARMRAFVDAVHGAAQA